MKKADLNTIFTAKVNNYLTKGYTFYTESMGGSQGEIAKVDLTNGEEVIRILIDHNYSNWHGDLHLNDGYSVKVGRATEIHPSFDGKLIWNNKLEILDQEDFYQAGYHTDYLITKEEAIANAEKHEARFKARISTSSEETITDKAVIKALIPYIQKLNGCKSVKARHIKELTKYHPGNGTYSYHIHIEKKNSSKVEILSENLMKNIRKG